MFHHFPLLFCFQYILDLNLFRVTRYSLIITFCCCSVLMLIVLIGFLFKGFLKPNWNTGVGFSAGQLLYFHSTIFSKCWIYLNTVSSFSWNIVVILCSKYYFKFFAIFSLIYLYWFLEGIYYSFGFCKTIAFGDQPQATLLLAAPHLLLISLSWNKKKYQAINSSKLCLSSTKVICLISWEYEKVYDN